MWSCALGAQRKRGGVADFSLRNLYVRYDLGLEGEAADGRGRRKGRVYVWGSGEYPEPRDSHVQPLFGD
jgi:hypothetical protein